MVAKPPCRHLATGDLSLALGKCDITLPPSLLPEAQFLRASRNRGLGGGGGTGMLGGGLLAEAEGGLHPVQLLLLAVGAVEDLDPPPDRGLRLLDGASVPLQVRRAFAKVLPWAASASSRVRREALTSDSRHSWAATVLRTPRAASARCTKSSAWASYCRRMSPSASSRMPEATRAACHSTSVSRMMESSVSSRAWISAY